MLRESREAKSREAKREHHQERVDGGDGKKKRPREKTPSLYKRTHGPRQRGGNTRQDRISPVLAGFSGPFSGARSD